MSSRSIKVMQVITRLVRGGAQQVVLDLLRGLDQSRFELVLVAGDQTGEEGSLWPALEGLPIAVHHVPQLVRELSPWRDLRALAALRRLIEVERPTIVHSHTSKAGLLGSLAARRRRVPGVVLSPHGHIVEKGAEIPGIPARGFKRQLITTAARHSARLADVVIAPNAVERDEGIRHRMWTRKQSVTVPNGVDTERFVPRQRDPARVTLGWPIQEKIVGVVARLTREKGIDLALDCIARLDEVRLVVVGDGPERGNLMQQARSLGIEQRVTFLGMSDRVEELLPAFDALLIPSRTEAHGLVAAEALACRVPIVCAGVGGLRSLILHQETGLLVPPGDAAALAGALRHLLGHSALASHLTEMGHAFVTSSFSLAQMVRRTEEVYVELAGNS